MTTSAECYRTRYHVIMPHEVCNRYTGSPKEVQSELKHSFAGGDDDAKLAADNLESESLFDDYERNRVELVGIDITVPVKSNKSSSSNNSKRGDAASTTTKSTNNEVKSTDHSGCDLLDDSSINSKNGTRRNRRSLLRQVTSKRRMSDKTTGSPDAPAANAKTIPSLLLKSESKRRMHVRRESSSTSLRGRSTSSPSTSNTESILSIKSSNQTTSSNHSGGGSGRRKQQKPNSDSSNESLLLKLFNIDPTKHRQKVDEEAFLELIDKDPQLCFKKFEFNSTLLGVTANGTSGDLVYPLHIICALGASLSTVKQCYKVNTDAMEYRSTSKGMTCLHYAVLYTRAPLDVIMFIMKKDPHAIRTATSRKKQTPLHLACMCPTSYKVYNPEVILLLTEIGQETVCMEVDRHGRTPLHIACGQDEPCLEVVEDLTEVNAAACIKQCYDYESTPLHLACANVNVNDESNVIVDVIKDLIRSKPDSVRIRDKDGQLPIYVAVTNNACLKICKMLVKKYPECLEVLTKSAEQDGTSSKDGITLHELAKQRKLDQCITDFLNPYEDDE